MVARHHCYALICYVCCEICIRTEITFPKNMTIQDFNSALIPESRPWGRDHAQKVERVDTKGTGQGFERASGFLLKIVKYHLTLVSKVGCIVGLDLFNQTQALSSIRSGSIATKYVLIVSWLKTNWGCPTDIKFSPFILSPSIVISSVSKTHNIIQREF